MPYKNKLLEFSEKELEHLNFHDTRVSRDIMSLLENLDNLCGSNKKLMLNIVSMLPRLIELQPIAPITENDFEKDEKTNEVGSEIREQCTRSPHIYRGKDGKYYDDRYYTFKFSSANPNDKMFIYQNGRSSKKEIDLPYMPEERVIYLDDNDDQGNFFHDVVSSSQ